MRLPLVTLALCAPALADFTFDDFSDTTNLTLVGAASTSAGSLRVCPNVPNLAGAVWYDVRQDVTRPFTTEVAFSLSGGAEGLAFVVQRAGTTALGGAGDPMGYGGIPNSVAIELDSFLSLANGDPTGNHVAVHTRGPGPNDAGNAGRLGDSSVVALLADGAPHVLRIEYAPGALRVYVDDLARPALQVAVDLAATLDLDDGTAWVGFTAATNASSWQNHFVHAWSFDEAAAVGSGNVAPDAPVIQEPENDGEILNPADVHMETSLLSDPDGDAHAASDFEIWTLTPPERVWQGHDMTGLEAVHAHFGDGEFVGSYAGRTDLKEQEAYVFRARHRDDSGDPWTDFGPWAERTFQTGATTDFYPLEVDDLSASPVPEWVEAATDADVVLPAGTPPPALHLESASGALLLSIAGFDGQTNQLDNPPALPEHVAVRARITGGDAGLNLPKTDLTVVDHECTVTTILLPALTLPPGGAAYLWITTDGATWYGDAGQTEPDFTDPARSSQLPWVSQRPNLRVEVVAGDFQLPVNVAFVPDPGAGPGDPKLYVTELYGTIKVVTNDGTVGDFATGLLNFNPTGAFPGSGEQGLTGIAVDPLSGDVFASLLYDVAGTHYPKVVRFTSLDGGLTAASETTILDMAGEPQGQSHQISHLEFHPDGRLVVHMGDGFDATTSQDLGSFRGKILRLEAGGAPAVDNPFYDPSDGIDATDYVWAYGVRNPFGGRWRAADGAHYEVENGPSVDRFGRLTPGKNFGWDGTNTSMFLESLYNWAPAHAPVNLAFVQPETFGGSGFPPQYMDRAFVTESGPTYAKGPQSRGKRIVEFLLDPAGNVLAGPETVLEYVGTGRATAVGLAAGPDGLYFTELYKNKGNDPTAPGARLLRVRWAGLVEGCGDVGAPYCGPAVPNSTGAPANLSASGSDEAAENDLTLTATSLPPNRFGYFLVSATQGFVANPGGSQGNLCLAGTIGRFVAQIRNSGPGGTFAIPVDLTALPGGLGSVAPGETWNFQAWYRDVNPTATSNFTQGLEVSFH